MRIVLEWLGLVEPERSRREPVAVPAWAPAALAAAVALGAGALALAVFLLARALAG